MLAGDRDDDPRLARRRMAAQRIDRRLVLRGCWHSLGTAWATVFPLNKQLWTSSYVLCNRGVRCGARAGHALIEPPPLPALGRAGVNAIAAYAPRGSRSGARRPALGGAACTRRASAG